MTIQTLLERTLYSSPNKCVYELTVEQSRVQCRRSVGVVSSEVVSRVLTPVGQLTGTGDCCTSPHLGLCY